jgi:hypothetical protein
MSLIGAKVSKLHAQRAAPHDSMAAISGMPEVECAPHFGDIATNEIGIASKTAASEDQCIAADPLPRAIRTADLNSENAPIAILRRSAALCVRMTMSFCSAALGSRSMSPRRYGLAGHACAWRNAPDS